MQVAGSGDSAQQSLNVSQGDKVRLICDVYDVTFTDNYVIIRLTFRWQSVMAARWHPKSISCRGISQWNLMKSQNTVIYRLSHFEGNFWNSQKSTTVFDLRISRLEISEYRGTIVRPCDKKDASQPQKGLIRIDGIIVGDRNQFQDCLIWSEEKLSFRFSCKLFAIFRKSEKQSTPRYSGARHWVQRAWSVPAFVYIDRKVSPPN